MPSRLPIHGLSLFLLLLPGLGAFAQESGTYTATIRGEARSFTLVRSNQQGVAYVSLFGAASQLGAGVNERGGRIRIDMQGRSAQAVINDTTVDASEARFSLQYPIIERNGDVLVAATDLPAFFEQAFAVPVAAAAPEPELDLLTELDPTAPPVSVPTPPAPAEPAPAPASLGTLRTVVIDPGHGGYDTGCVGANGLEEKALTLALAQELGAKLLEQGLTVHLTRQEDQDISQPDRVELMAQTKADVFISLHAGASYSPAARGVGLYYMPEDALLGAAAARASGTIISPAMRRAYAAKSRALAQSLAQSLPAATGAEFHGMYEVPLRVAHGTPMPGVLIEVGFLTNAEEERALSDAAYRTRIADGIVQGLRNALAAR